MKSRIVVLGAGPAGLSAAWQLALAGYQVTVLEKDNLLGGLCQTVEYKDFRFDLGGHRFFSQNEDLVEKITKLMGQELLVRPRTSVIRLQGKYFRYPIELPDLLRKLQLNTTIKCLFGYAYEAIKNRLGESPDSNYERWLVKRYGIPLYNLYFAPYSEKLWGTTMNHMSSDWAAQRISELSFWDVVISLFTAKKDEVRTFTRDFYYPRLGIGQITDKMAEVVQSQNGQVLTNSPVVGIDLSKKPYKVTYLRNGNSTTIPADYVISTIPITDFVKGVRSHVDPKIQKLASRLYFRSLIFLNILLDQNQVSENTWIYVPEKKYQIMRLQEPKNWQPTNAPENKTSMICEIACDYNDETWNVDKDAVYERCIRELDELGFHGLKMNTIDYFITKAQHAYPVYFLGYRQIRETLIDYFNQFSDLILCGRQALYRYNNMDHSLEMGLNAANVIINNAHKNKIYEIAENKVYLEKNHIIRETENSLLQE